jgi:hypothetical protein
MLSNNFMFIISLLLLVALFAPSSVDGFNLRNLRKGPSLAALLQG